MEESSRVEEESYWVPPVSDPVTKQRKEWRSFAEKAREEMKADDSMGGLELVPFELLKRLVVRVRK